MLKSLIPFYVLSDAPTGLRGGTRYRYVVIGGSAGGVEALSAILSVLPADFSLPVLAVQHLHSSDEGNFALHMDRATRLHVVEPCDKEQIEHGHVYNQADKFVLAIVIVDGEEYEGPYYLV